MAPSSNHHHTGLNFHSSTLSCASENENSVLLQEKGRPLPKFGEWDVNDPTSAEGFTVIFNKARDEKKTGGKPDSPSKVDTNTNYGGAEPIKPQGSGLLSTQFIQALAVSLNFPYNHEEKMVLLHAEPECNILTMSMCRRNM
ncbi:hypothetical protein SASPL_132833 [Salvia splendens]|uniref:RIN4 pathogenic type III effector avirulence factor Avr cleavage site domain-containing protein n=1 Tax=Salvia splendens TaxID=180675 RepID=A0A8X8X1M8_SALSN|nr:hypothetical protein SASPL_132833 [Salvia splendens]